MARLPATETAAQSTARPQSRRSGGATLTEAVVATRASNEGSRRFNNNHGEGPNKALSNQENALVGASSAIVKFSRTFV